MFKIKRNDGFFWKCIWSFRSINVTKSIQPKGLYLTRPSIAHYTTTREELDEAANKVFEMASSGKVKLKFLKNIL